MSDLAVGATWYRARCRPQPPADDDGVNSPPIPASSAGRCLGDRIAAAVEAAECPAGWPVFDPARYAEQLEMKAAIVRNSFAEVTTVEVFGSPVDRHRMRCKVGVTGSESADTLRYTHLEQRLDVLEIAAAGIQAAMPLVLAAAKEEPLLRRNLTMMSFLGTRDGGDVIVCLVYGAPLNPAAWKAAAERAQRRWDGSGVAVSFIGQARGVKVVAGEEFLTETYSLSDGRCLQYKHVFGHFSNPNAYACEHTLEWLSAAVRTMIPSDQRQGRDLLEIYCGNGNHTVALAPLFRAALAVEINPSLCAAAEDNLRANGVGNAWVQRSPSADFCTRVLRRRNWTHTASGTAFDFSTVLVDPPRAGLDPVTLGLVAKYDHILYISCNPLVSLRRDADGLRSRGFTLAKLALIDHFPYTPHTECAAFFTRDAPSTGPAAVAGEQARASVDRHS
jgi:tRNA (uracil-5-)-methyltransferase